MTTWTVRRIDLGHTAYEARVGGVALRVDLFDGGGFCASTAAWRVAGRVVRVDEAGRC